jgi:hypothetical protein
MYNQGIYKDNKMTGPLGQYAIAGSQVQTPGWKPLEGPETPFEQATGGGRGGSFGFQLGGPQRYTQAQYEAAMAETYANVRVGTDANGNPIYGYTGQDERLTGGVNMSRAGTRADTNPYVYGSRVNGPLGGVGSSNPRKNYFNGRRVTGGR